LSPRLAALQHNNKAPAIAGYNIHHANLITALYKDMIMTLVSLGFHLDWFFVDICHQKLSYG
jgi:hypothetical protein